MGEHADECHVSIQDAWRSWDNADRLRCLELAKGNAADTKKLQDYDAELFKAFMDLTLSKLEAAEKDWSDLRDRTDAATRAIKESLARLQFVVGFFDLIGETTRLLKESVVLANE